MNMSNFQRWRKSRRERCRITEEWGGIFIGRRSCSTHNAVWDDRRECPKTPFFLGRYRNDAPRY